MALLMSIGVASPAGAQGDGHDHEHGSGSGHRLTEQHRWRDPEGRLMGYYSAALAFSPVGAPAVAAPWALTLGLEASYLPPLSEAQRSAGFSKTEYTNLSPVLPRPRLALSLPFGVAVEGSWIPPIEAFSVTANLVSGAISRPFPVRGVLVTPRVAATTGSVRGPMTCNNELADGSDGDLLFFQHICHGMESEDRFEPRAVSGELMVSRSMRGGSLTPYIGGGVRSEEDRFEIGVRFTDGSLDPNHPILTMDLTRGYGFLGATWAGRGRGAISGELFYAPGSLVTVRVQASLRLLRAS
jgi:hypothetical protein